MTEMLKKSKGQLQAVGDLLEAFQIIQEVVKDPKAMVKFAKGLSEVDSLLEQQEIARADIKKNQVIADKADLVRIDLDKNATLLGEIKAEKKALLEAKDAYGPDLLKLSKGQSDLVTSQKKFTDNQDKFAAEVAAFENEKKQFIADSKQKQIDYENIIKEHNRQNDELQTTLNVSIEDFKLKLKTLNDLG